MYVHAFCSLFKNFDGLAQDCSNSIVNALEILQSCFKLLIYKTALEVIPNVHSIIWFSTTGRIGSAIHMALHLFIVQF